MGLKLITVNILGQQYLYAGLIILGKWNLMQVGLFECMQYQSYHFKKYF